MAHKEFTNAYPIEFFGDLKARASAPRSSERGPTPVQVAYERQYGRIQAQRASHKLDRVELLTLEEAATELRRMKKDGRPNGAAIYKLIKAGRLRGTRDGWQWKIRRDHLNEYIERCTRAGGRSRRLGMRALGAS